MLLLVAAIIYGRYALQLWSHPVDLWLKVSIGTGGLAFVVQVVNAVIQRGQTQRLKEQLMRELGRSPGMEEC